MMRVSALNSLQFAPDKCTGCRMCTAVCPHGVFAQPDGVAELVRADACMECGACQLNCPSDAILVDSGVGCATAMIVAALTGKKEATCGPSDPVSSPSDEGGACCSASGGSSSCCG